MTAYEVVIGLEVHVQLATASKLFCSCSTTFGAEPNTQVCPVCLGHPGTLPVPNRRAIEFAIRMGLATHSQIAETSIWARKNYFYPDLPKGYQISQFDRPICERGTLVIHLDEARSGPKSEKPDADDTRSIAIQRIHLEEDAGKSKHSGGSYSQIDLNRCGVPLIEIVSEPDLRSAEEAVAYMMALRQLVQYTGAGDGNMEEGSLRCDANVSVRPLGQVELGVRAEVKNINSFRFVEKAILHEADRQIALLESGQPVLQETRGWDEERSRTYSMRGKEEAHDYRYFPDPDLPPLSVPASWIDQIEAGMSELPEAKRNRFAKELGLSQADLVVLTQTRALAEYFEEVSSALGNPRVASNWVKGDLLALLNKSGQTIDSSPIPAARLAELLTKVEAGAVSGKLAKQALEEMFETGDDAGTVIERHGWEVVSDEGALRGLIEEAMRNNPEELAGYRAGKETLLNFFVGQVMKLSRGQADPKRLPGLLREMLSP